MTAVRFAKGHGTRNDFVLIADLRGEYELTAEATRALADRRSGIGGDGVIRLAPTFAVPERHAVLEEDPGATWFMDYRNADGSVAEMCGNGVRVFAAYAERLKLVSFEDGAVIPIGTRAGVKYVQRLPNGWFAVDMGRWSLPGGAEAAARGYDSAVRMSGWAVPRPALSVDMGNPHTVLAVADTGLLAAADLTVEPAVDPVPPRGTNVEVVVPLGEVVAAGGIRVGRLRMRVHERGVGETESCGTGVCAAALAARCWAGGHPDVWSVEVPGGTLQVRLLANDRVELSGPAQVVCTGEVDVDALLGLPPKTATAPAIVGEPVADPAPEAEAGERPEATTAEAGEARAEQDSGRPAGPTPPEGADGAGAGPRPAGEAPSAEAGTAGGPVRAAAE